MRWWLRAVNWQRVRGRSDEGIKLRRTLCQGRWNSIRAPHEWQSDIQPMFYPAWCMTNRNRHVLVQKIKWLEILWKLVFENCLCSSKGFIAFVFVANMHLPTFTVEGYLIRPEEWRSEGGVEDICNDKLFPTLMITVNYVQWDNKHQVLKQCTKMRAKYLK